SIDVIDDNESKTYFGFGAFMAIHVNESFSIQPELLYMKKGTVFSESEVVVYEGVPITVTMETESKATFLEIPILLKLSVPTEGKVSPSFFAGPAIAFTMSAKDKITLTASAMGESYSESEEVDTKDETASMDFGLVLGGGVNFLLTNVKLSVDGRYTLGMSDLADDSDYVEVKVRTFSIMVGISFPVGPK
ncbi:MAG: PorT family protein, partial [Proteobacteria bacterium]|nr:PorT family protein [Pseudomonadota bacterium]